MFSNINWRDTAERGIWTFVQGFVGTFTVVNVFDIAEVQAAAAAAAAAGIAALISFIKNVVKQNVV